jgi:hypothetical protein
MSRLLFPAAALAGFAACAPAELAMPTDMDQDGLLSNEEEGIGTDPDNADSDGDGVDDGEELNKGTDPLDEGSVPYIGGWDIDSQCKDSLSAEGNEVGDVTDNFAAPDSNGQDVHLWDFCGRAVLITSGAFW